MHKAVSVNDCFRLPKDHKYKIKWRTDLFFHGLMKFGHANTDSGIMMIARICGPRPVEIGSSDFDIMAHVGMVWMDGRFAPNVPPYSLIDRLVGRAYDCYFYNDKFYLKAVNLDGSLYCTKLRHGVAELDVGLYHEIEVDKEGGQS